MYLYLRRLHGSYEALKYGTSLDGLSDLTGGIAESLSLRPPQLANDIIDVVSHLLKLTSIVLCKVESGSSKESSTISEVRKKGLCPYWVGISHAIGKKWMNTY